MRILVDISHPAHVNFLKYAIFKLKESGHDIFISYIRRGKLHDIVRNEFLDHKILNCGKSSGSKLSIILNANILKYLILVYFILIYKIDVGLMGNFVMAAALKLFRKDSFFKPEH